MSSYLDFDDLRESFPVLLFYDSKGCAFYSEVETLEKTLRNSSLSGFLVLSSQTTYGHALSLQPTSALPLELPGSSWQNSCYQSECCLCPLKSLMPGDSVL